MIREIVVPTSNQLVIEIPESYIGRKIEYLVFDLIDQNEVKISKTEDFATRTKHLQFDSGGYKFDRTDANDYPTTNGSH